MAINTRMNVKVSWTHEVDSTFIINHHGNSQSLAGLEYEKDEISSGINTANVIHIYGREAAVDKDIHEAWNRIAQLISSTYVRYPNGKFNSLMS